MTNGYDPERGGFTDAGLALLGTIGVIIAASFLLETFTGIPLIWGVITATWNNLPWSLAWIFGSIFGIPLLFGILRRVPDFAYRWTGAGWLGKIAKSTGPYWQSRAGYRGARNAFVKNFILGRMTKFAHKMGYKDKYFRLRNVPGREGEIVYRNRLLFMRLLDQNLRFDIWEVKYLAIKAYTKKLIELSGEANIKEFKDQASLKKIILYLMSHEAQINIGDEPNRILLGERPKTAPFHPTLTTNPGWNYSNRILIEYMNNLMTFLEEQVRISNPRTRGDLDMRRFNDIISAEALKREKNDIPRIKQPWGTSYAAYTERVANYIPHYHIKALALHIWDMMENAGVASHRYRFAKRDARYREGTTEGEVQNDTTEVNLYGEFIEDIQKNRWPRRRLINPKRDSLPYPPELTMGSIGNYFEADWAGFLKDFREGFWHPHTRNVAEYLKAWKEGKWKDDEIDWPPRGGRESFAFDLRVLLNPGIFSWQGRRNFDSGETDIFDENLEPHISQKGIHDFITNLIDKTSAQIKEDYAALSVYPSETGEPPSTLADREAGKFSIARFKKR